MDAAAGDSLQNAPSVKSHAVPMTRLSRAASTTGAVTGMRNGDPLSLPVVTRMFGLGHFGIIRHLW
jgi:hypothetical protein